MARFPRRLEAQQSEVTQGGQLVQKVAKLCIRLKSTVQFITGMQNIRDIIPFPRTPKNAEF